MRPVLRGRLVFRLRRERKFVAKSLGETLGGFRGKPFEVVTDECPNVADFGEVSLSFERPTFQRGFAFPEKFIVTVNEKAVAIVFGRVIAQ